GHAGASLDNDTVLGHAFDVGFAGGGIRAVDHLGIDGGLDGFEHGLAGALGGEVDGARTVEHEVDAGLFGGDEREHDHLDVATCEVVSGEVVNGEGQPRFDGGDAGVHDQADRDAAQAQGDQLGELHARAGEEGAHPDTE